MLLKMKALEGYMVGEVDEPIENKGVEWKKCIMIELGILVCC
jgi:hypothetical protein